MLTIQMLRLFDKLWKGIYYLHLIIQFNFINYLNIIDSGLDFRLTFYNVIATNYKIGLIEVVPQANTVANIQKQYAFSSATSAFQKR